MKWILSLLALLMLTVMSFSLFAGNSTELILDALAPLIIELAKKYPILISVVMLMGFARTVIKPFMSLLLIVVENTNTTKDNEWLESLKENQMYKIIVYVLDWSTSIKLPKK